MFKQEDERAPALFLVAVLLVAHILFATTYPGFINPNPLSRAYLTWAIVDDQTFQIDANIARYGDVQDKAAYQGRYFTDKPPGASVLLIPAALAADLVVGPDSTLSTRLEALRFFGLTVPTVLFWLFFYFWLRRVPGNDVDAATETRLSQNTTRVALTVLGALGTSFFVYTTQLFSHAFAGMLLFLAYAAHQRGSATEQSTQERNAWSFCAGFLLACAVANDLIVVLAAGLVGLSVLRRRRSAFAFVLGCSIPLAALFAYNQLCFEHPLRFGFHFHADPTYGTPYNEGVAGVQTPALAAIFGTTLLPSRGITFYTPVFLLAPLAVFRMRQQSTKRKEDVDVTWILSVALGVFLFTLTTVDWRGGWSVASRYLVPTVPFLMLAIAHLILHPSTSDRLRVIAATLSLVGLWHSFLTLSTFPCFPSDVENPVYELAAPLLRSGYVSPSLIEAIEGVHLIVFAAVLAGVATLVLHAFARTSRRALVALSAATAMVLALSAIPSEPVDKRTFQRAVQALGYEPTLDTPSQQQLK